MMTTESPNLTPDPMPTNLAVQLGDSLVSKAVDTGITAGETLLFSDFPILAFPGIKQLVELAIDFISHYIVKGLSQVMTFTIIDVQVGAEETVYSKALAALKAAQASGDPNAIANALSVFQKAAESLGTTDGTNSA